MKILLSAYACEPNTGSEPGVGWRWAIEIEKLGHEVWVLTRTNNQEVIDEYFSTHDKPQNLYFQYYDLPTWAKKWKKGARGVRSYYFLWQWGAYQTAKALHKNKGFDLVHHITFGVVRQPSFMGNLGIPFIFGPVGGGEKCPWKLRTNFGIKGLTLDAIRDILNSLVKFDPFMWLTFYQANKIYVKTPESKNIIPKLFWNKTEISLEIGIDADKNTNLPVLDISNNIRFLYVGRFIYWKGMDIGLSVFAKIVKQFPSATLTLVGKGSDEKRWKNHAEKLGISSNVIWINWVTQKELFNIYKTHHMFLFTSLHDSSGNVILEAMSRGLPVACLNLGGPGVIVNNKYGIKVDVKNKSKDNIIDELYKKIIHVFNNEKNIKTLQKEALEASRKFQWSKIISEVYCDY